MKLFFISTFITVTILAIIGVVAASVVIPSEKTIEHCITNCK